MCLECWLIITLMICWSYNFEFHLLIHFQMTTKVISREQLKTLLETANNQVQTILMSNSQHHNQSFYENFAGISLRVIRYIISFINLTNSDQQIGKILGELREGLTQSIKEYKGRNIFAVSVRALEEDHSPEDDQIYHFMNTRNKLLPLECLSNYQNDKQRRQLEEFVQEMKKHENASKKSIKKSAVSIKQENIDLKGASKETRDPLIIPESQNVAVQVQQPNQKQDDTLLPPPQPTIQDIQIQTDCIQQNEQYQCTPSNKSQLEFPSQCVSMSDAIQATLSQKHLAIPASSKNKKNKNNIIKSDSKSKKMIKFGTSNQPTLKFIEPVVSQKQKAAKKNKKNAQPSKDCSIKLIKFNDRTLSLCSKVVDQILQKDENIVIANIGDQKEVIQGSKTASQENELEQNELEQNELEQNVPNIEAKNEQKQYNNQQKSRILQLQDPHQQNMDSIIEHSIEDSKQQIQQMVSTKDTTAQKDEKNELQKPQGKIKYIIMKSNTKLMNKLQKIPTSSIRILEQKQIESLKNESNFSFHSKSTLIDDEKTSRNLKHKISADKKHLLQSFIQKQQQNMAMNVCQNLRTSKMNINMLSSIKNELQKSVEPFLKSPSFAKESGSAIASVSSQDYLVSREKADVDCFQQQRKQILIEDEKIQDIDTKANGTPTFNHKNDVESQPSCAERPAQNTMIRVSNAYCIRQSGKKSNEDHSQTPENKQNTKYLQTSQQIKRKKQSRKHLFHKKSQQSFLRESTKTDQCDNSIIVTKPTFRTPITPTNELAEVEQLPKKSIFCRQTTQLLPKRVRMEKLKGQMRSQSGPHLFHHQRQSSSNLTSSKFEIQQLRRKLRNRAYEDKLSHYLHLIQITHQQFCGPHCEHIKELFTTKEGSVAQQILRLFQKLK